VTPSLLLCILFPRLNVISEFFHKEGGPGAFQGKAKLKLAFRAAGYRVNDLELENFLKKKLKLTINFRTSTDD